jgi:hypothetical protein
VPFPSILTHTRDTSVISPFIPQEQVLYSLFPSTFDTTHVPFP